PGRAARAPARCRAPPPRSAPRPPPSAPPRRPSPPATGAPRQGPNRARSSFPLRPHRLERPALRRRHVAVAGPAAGERQGGEAALGAARPAEEAHGEPARRAVEGRVEGEEGPELQARAPGGGLEVALELALTPVAHQLGQRDLDRADRLAAAAEAGG